MAKEAKKNNKNLIIGICAGIVILAITVVAIVFGIREGGLLGLNDSYFVSDGNKYVLSFGSDEIISNDEEHVPEKLHIVYTYANDKITGLKTYYEYKNEEDATSAYEYLSTDAGITYKNITQEGKFVIIESNESDWEGVTPDDVKQQVEIRNNRDNTEPAEEDVVETEVEEIVSGGEEVEIIDDVTTEEVAE